jgi:predicted ArsR family transcriptional regulator
LTAGNGNDSNKVREGGASYFDPQFKRLVWYLIASTRGGINRARIIELINSHPSNANQIAQELKLDYKTIVHHLDMLSQNGLVITDNKSTYGATYFLSPLMEKNYQSFTEILVKFGKK